MTLRYLSLSAEEAPWSRSGGLAEVAGSLPKALAAHWAREEREVEVWSVSPLYPSAWREVARRGLRLREGPHVPLAPLSYESAQLWYLSIDSDPSDESSVSRGHLFVDLPAAFDRDALYGPSGGAYEDNPLRFAALSLTAIRVPEAFEEWLAGLHERIPALHFTSGVTDHLLHCHDWQAAFAPLLLQRGWARTQFKTVFTIHNLRHQGLAAARWVPLLGLSWDDFHFDRLEHWGHFNPLKGALRAVDLVTTVSPTYAQEIFEPQFGCELDDYLNAHQLEVTGIVNGLDLDTWSPHKAPQLAQPLPSDPTDDELTAWKRVHREEVAPAIYQQGEGSRTGPWGVMVSRFDAQKGVELVVECAPRWIARGVKLCILGSGDPQLEAKIRALEARFPDAVKVYIGFDLRRAHQLFAAADFTLVPSRFEPCGLTQMQSMRYGALPLATRVGGLADTIHDISSRALRRDEVHEIDQLEDSAPSVIGDGFLATAPNVWALDEAMERLLDVWSRPEVWCAARRNALQRDLSWDKRARTWSEVLVRLMS